MISLAVRVLTALVVLAVLLPGQTARADGPLPLKPGIYVLAGVPCGGGTAADRLYYYLGDKNVYCFGIPHGECKITHVRNQGKIYYVTLQCLAKGVEGKFTWHWTITVKSPTSFSVREYPEKPTGAEKKERVFRWCDD